MSKTTIAAAMEPLSPTDTEPKQASADQAATKINAASQSPGDSGTYCPRCGTVVPLTVGHCPRCGKEVYHEASRTQRYGLLAGMGFIILGGILVFLQPRAYHTFMQDVFECGIILCVVGAGIAFFLAVADMIRRGGE